MNILALLADPNFLTIVTTAVGSLITWFAARHGTVSAPAEVRQMLPGLLPALQQLVAHRASLQSHGVLQDLAQLGLGLVPPAPPTPAPAAK